MTDGKTEVIEPLRRGKVLSERVVWHEDFIFHHVGEHAVWPVQHRRLNELQHSLAQLQLVACFHGLNIEVCAVMLDYSVFSSCRSDYGGVFRVLGDYG